MENVKWSRDIIIGNRVDRLPPRQAEHYGMIREIDHIVNSAIAGKREISTGRCNALQYSEFVQSIYKTYCNTLDTLHTCCQADEKPLLFDAVTQIAEYAYLAVKNIALNPSRTITKVDVKIPTSRATNFGNKTMRWLSTRPGYVIEEKVAPENKVLTSKTVFTVDTKENREFMYLYKRLHEAICARLPCAACAQCNMQHECGREWARHLKNLSATYSQLRLSELGSVKGEKQAVQNNKLMCDLNYKIVWDAVKKLSYIEEHTAKANATLAQRFAQLIYWVLLGRVMADNQAAIIDCMGYVADVYDGEKNNDLRFVDIETGGPHKNDTVIFRDDGAKHIKTLHAVLDDTRIKITDSSSVGVYELDIADWL